jgi:uncharacterized membrane protein
MNRALTAANTGLVLVAFTVAGFAVNAAVRMPCRDVCGSDVGRDYLDRGIDRAHPPFLVRDFEYPPLVGEVMWAAAAPFDHGFRGPFLLNALVLTALAAATTWLLWRRYGLRARRWALAPPLFLQGLTNWDLLAVAPATMGLLAWERNAAFLAGALFGVGTAAKLFPALFIPILVTAEAVARRWRAATRVIVGFVAGVAVCAVPIYAFAPDALHYFLTFHANRTPTRGSILFFLFRDPMMHPWLSHQAEARATTLVAAAAILAVMAVLVAYTARRRVSPLAACALATLAFVVTNKVYSPQYDLWLVPFLVMLPVRTRLVAHFYVSSSLVWLLTALMPNIAPSPWRLYVVGIAVGYRLVVFVLIGRDFSSAGARRALPVAAD